MQLKQFCPPFVQDLCSLLLTSIEYKQFSDVLSINSKVKDIHNGQRCFVLGSGPSIKQQDLRLLNSEIVFALNNFFVHPDFKEIVAGNSQKYYLLAPTHQPQSRAEWKEWLLEISKQIPKNVHFWFGVNSYQDSIYSIVKECGLFKDQQVNWFFPRIGLNRVSVKNFDSCLDLTKPILQGGAASVYAIIVALYMGFSQVYLLGMDHNYFCFQRQEDYRFYQNGLHQNKEEERVRAVTGLSSNTQCLLETGNIFKTYNLIKQNTQSQIINLATGSICDVFERAEYEDIIHAL